MKRSFTVGKRLPPLDPPARGEGLRGPDWRQAEPDRIEKALQHALSKPAGGWYVLDGSRAMQGTEPAHYRVAGKDLVVWRHAGRLLAAPDACPHMGASLSCARAEEGRLICPWHGLALGPKGFPGWSLYEVHDDGVLTWVRLDDEPDLTARPYLPPRPTRCIDAVIRMAARCDPEDVIANRLDPWHGVHFHPYSFATLRVIEADDERLKLRVAYRVFGPVRIEVDATFHCPDPRTIVMTIVDGEGVGSVVETHATPIEPGRTAIIEATLATSERTGFAHALRAARLIRPFIRRTAQRLWVDDAAYAERLYDLRMGRAEAPRKLKAPRWSSRLHRSEGVVMLEGERRRVG